MFTNPFYISNIENGNISCMSYQDTKKNYKHCYLLVSKKNDDIDESLISLIFDKSIDASIATELFSKFELIKAPITLMYSFNMKKKANIVSGDFLDKYFKYHQFDVDEIVIPFYELTNTSCQMLVNMCKTTTTLDNIKQTLAMITYYKNNNRTFDDKICNMIMDLDSTKFWQNPNNCQLNLDKIFASRFMTYNCVKLDKINVFNDAIDDDSEFDNINDLIVEFNNAMKEENYMPADMDTQDVYQAKKKNNYTTIKTVLDEATKRTFYSTNDHNTEYSYSKDEIADLIDFIKDNESDNHKIRYYLLNTLLVSKEYCHLILNNKRVLSSCSDLFEKYKPLYIYLIGYAWITFYIEENLTYTRSSKNDRFSFDIETANLLPMFPFSFENIYVNPYFSMLNDKTKIDYKDNCLSYNALVDYKKYYGVATKEEAMKRFNIFTTGKNVNIFENLDSNVFSFSGSIIPACLQRYSPLIEKFDDKNSSYESNMNKYFDHYYANSDIDVMVSTNTQYEYFNHVNNFLDTIITNIKKFDKTINRDDVNVVAHKKPIVIITKYFENYCLEALNKQFNTTFTIDDFTQIEFIAKLKEYIYPMYEKNKKQQREKWNEAKQTSTIDNDKINNLDKILEMFHTISTIDELEFKKTHYDVEKAKYSNKSNNVCYFVNDIVDIDNQVSEDKNYLVFKICESIKFKINSNKMKRVMEIFQIASYDPYNTVARFHLPCVRAYMQNNNFYMLSSFITAMMTSINIDYKYFCGSHDPICILNKYRQRGYGVILNNKEKRGFWNYNKKIKSLFKVKTKTELFGSLKLDNKIFIDNAYDYIDEYQHEKPVFSTNEDIIKFYDENYKVSSLPVNIMKFSSVANNGNVAPYQSWVQDAYFRNN